MGKIIPKISGAITGDAFCENFSLLRILLRGLWDFMYNIGHAGKVSTYLP